MKTNVTLAARLLVGVAAISLTVASRVYAADPQATAAQAVNPTPTPAAQPAPQADTNTLQTVVVTGFRKSLADALQEKLSAPAIIDTIASEDIGKFPEQNLAESLQRITGVQIQRNNGEGQYVSIRGLDPKFTVVTLDGHQMPSPTGARTFDYSILSSEFVGAIDVYKSPTADLPEGGLAGTVNVKTIDAANVKGFQLVLNAKENYDVNSDLHDPHLTALFTDRFLDDKLGVVVGVDHNKSDYQYNDYYGFGVLPLPIQGGTKTALFDAAEVWAQFAGVRERSTYLVNTEYRVSQDLRFYVKGLYSSNSENYQQYDNVFRQVNPLSEAAQTGAAAPVLKSVDGQTLATSYDILGVDNRNNARPDYLTSTLGTASAGADYSVGNWQFNLDAYAATARSRETNFALDAIGRANETSNINSGPATFTYDPGYNNLAPGALVGIGADGQYNQPEIDKIKAISFNGSYSVNNDWISKVRFGGRAAEETNAHFDSSEIVTAQTMASLLGATYDPVREDGSFGISPYLTQKTINFFGQTQTFYTANTNALLAQVPMSKILASTPETVNLADTYVITEDDYSAFFRVDYRTPNWPIKGNFGVRYVSTNQTSSGYAPNLSQVEFSQQGAVTIIPQVTATTVKQSYSNVLPDFNFIYSVTPKLLLRFAAAETMTRPDLSQIAPNTTVNANVLSITEGNPTLKPYTATQFDLSGEWYFAKSGLVSLAAFTKDVKNFVQNGSSSVTLNVNQISGAGAQGGGTVPLTFSVFQPKNAGSTTVQGLEFGYQQSFDFLPAPFDGFGVVANYTYITADPIVVTAGSAPVPISGLSNNSYNLVGFYEKGPIGIRLAYNYRGAYVVDPSSYFGDGDYRKAYGQLDASASYHVTPRLDFSVEALNITNSALIDVDKYGINRGYEQFGTTVMMGVRYKL